MRAFAPAVVAVTLVLSLVRVGGARPAAAGGAGGAGGGSQGAASGPSGGSLLAGVFTPAQASGGERTFNRVCAACHDTTEFSGGRFRLSWVGRTVGDLFDSISTLMPEGDPGSLSPGEYASLVAYLLQVNGYPAGEMPLPAELPALRLMEIVERP